MERVRTSKHPVSVASCYFFGSLSLSIYIYSVCHLPKIRVFKLVLSLIWRWMFIKWALLLRRIFCRVWWVPCMRAQRPIGVGFGVLTIMLARKVTLNSWGWYISDDDMFYNVLYVYQWYHYYKIFGHVLETMNTITWNVSFVSCIAGAIGVPHKRLHLVSWVGIHYLEVGSTTKRERLEMWWWWYICWQVRVMLTPLYLQHIQHGDASHPGITPATWNNCSPFQITSSCKSYVTVHVSILGAWVTEIYKLSVCVCCCYPCPSLIQSIMR